MSNNPEWTRERSDALNRQISTLCGDVSPSTTPPELLGCRGGKPVPHIGWFWRRVDFDSDKVFLGVITVEELSGYGEGICEGDFVGFMENNKWGYQSFEVAGERWCRLRAMVAALVEGRTMAQHRELVAYMQELWRLAQDERAVIPGWSYGEDKQEG